MAEYQPSASRRRRSRELGQNFLTDTRVVHRFLDSVEVVPGELIVDLGAGTGALTFPLLQRGATVIAVEVDPWALDELHRRRAGLDPDVQAGLRIIASPIERFRHPPATHRVVANPPFNRSTDILRRLLDDPDRGPDRIDLVLQREVVRKRTEQPPTTLQSAAWAPWWIFAHGMTVERSAFTPRPSVDAAVLRVVKRDEPVLPRWLAPGFAEVLRPRWNSTAT